MSENKKTWSVAAEIKAEQKAALKYMSRKEKSKYIWEYYKIQIITAIVSVILLISIIYNAATNRDYSYYAVIFNAVILDGEEIAEDFNTFAGIDGSRYHTFIDTSNVLDKDNVTPFEMAIIQRIMATIVAGHLDSIIADGYTFTYFADGEFFVDLRKVISAEELKRYENNLFYIDQAVIDRRNANVNMDSVLDIIVLDEEQRVAEVTLRRQPENMGNPVPVGIILTGSPLINDAYLTHEIPVLGIIGTSDRHELTMMFVEFLLR